jgi:hypothetical protein
MKNLTKKIIDSGVTLKSWNFGGQTLHAHKSVIVYGIFDGDSLICKVGRGIRTADLALRYFSLSSSNLREWDMLIAYNKKFKDLKQSCEKIIKERS